MLPNTDPRVAHAPPAMWAAALDVLMARLVRRGLDLAGLAGVSGAAQQHGSVYLTAQAAAVLRSLDPAQPLADQIEPMLARASAPIWMDASTAVECAEIEAAVGGAGALARRTGSRAFERFTAAQIRKFSRDDPGGYARTTAIHLVSSFLASLLTGAHAPLDPGDASGMNLMDLATSRWWPEAVSAAAPDLAAKLPAIVPAPAVIGRLAPYWCDRHGLPPVPVVVWSGDNPSSLAGSGLVREGQIGISLGTSDTVFGPMREPRAGMGAAAGAGHVFGAPTGEFMALTCFANGSLARARVRDRFRLDWAGFSRLLASTPPGNGGRLMLPWFEPEITPRVSVPGLVYHGLEDDDAAGQVRAVVEAQMMAMARHSAWMRVRPAEIRVTGGASANTAILQIIADVFGAPVTRAAGPNAAALGAALRAMHGVMAASGRHVAWDAIAGGGSAGAAAAIHPDAACHAIYRALMVRHEALERLALAAQS